MKIDTGGGNTMTIPVAKILGAIVALVVVIGILTFAFGWLDATVSVVSPANVKAQYHDAYSNYESLGAEACTVVAQRSVVAASTDPNVKVQLLSQQLAYEQTYRRIAAEYNAAYANAFEAKHVGPGDLPHVAPTLEEMIGARTC